LAAIANRYAKALADVSFRLGQHEKVGQDLADFGQLLTGSRELFLFYTNPAIQIARKKAATSEIFQRLQVSSLTSNFIFLLIDRHRVNYFHEIQKAYHVAINERQGVVQASITTASELDPRTLSSLEAGLARLTGKKVLLKSGIDQDLIGGVVARIGDTIYDGSVRQQLSLIKSRLSSD
jgi:F-type H+-transporting ATPase subunit delta